MNINEILLRDPYILEKDNTYYLYGSRVGAIAGKPGFDYQDGLEVYKSKDLITWSKGKSLFGDKGFFEKKCELWAPEIYCYKGKYYMFVTIKRYNDSKNKCRGTYVFTCDTPDGEFKLHSETAITPAEWECLDGHLYIENDKPYMIFCHEWEQATDGEFCVIEMDEELKHSVGNAKVLFSASSADWVVSKGNNVYVSDGPFMFREDGILYMLWSSFTDKGYAIGLSYSESGSVMGEWKHCSKPIFDKDGGHAMLFNTVDNIRKIIFHTPNASLKSSPKIEDFVKCGKRNYSMLEESN